MFSAAEFKNAIVNAEVSDLKMANRNLSYEKLLDKVTGQELLIKDYEEALQDYMADIATLTTKLENVTKEKYKLILEKERLEHSLLVLNSK